jgi:hypothetical protein
MMSYIFGSIAAVTSNLNKREHAFSEQMDLVQSTMKAIKLPVEIQNEVLNYLMHV